MTFWKNKKVLITGGAGFIGSHLAKKLVQDEAIVTCVDNLERGKKEYLSPIIDKITFHNKDVKDLETCIDITKETDIIFHLASKVGGIGYYLSKPSEVITENCLMDTNILTAVKKNQTPYFFYASSAHVYPKQYQAKIDSPLIKEEHTLPADPELSYSWAKLLMEKQCDYLVQEGTSTGVSIARLIGIYGENQDIDLATGSVIPVFTHRAIKYPDQGPFVVWGTGTETRSYCFIDDTIEIMKLMVEKSKDTYLGPLNIGKEERISIADLAKKIISISGKEIPIEFDTTKETKIWGQWCSCQKVKEALGWQASTPIETGLNKVYLDIQKKLNTQNIQELS